MPPLRRATRHNHIRREVKMIAALVSFRKGSYKTAPFAGRETKTTAERTEASILSRLRGRCLPVRRYYAYFLFPMIILAGFAPKALADVSMQIGNEPPLVLESPPTQEPAQPDIGNIVIEPVVPVPWYGGDRPRPKPPHPEPGPGPRPGPKPGPKPGSGPHPGSPGGSPHPTPPPPPAGPHPTPPAGGPPPTPVPPSGGGHPGPAHGGGGLPPRR